MEEIVEEEKEKEFKPLNNNKINGEKVEIVVRTIGPARPSRLQVPSPIKVSLFPSLFLSFPIWVFFLSSFLSFNLEEKKKKIQFLAIFKFEKNVY